MVTYPFLKKVLMKEKKLLKMKDVRPCHPPRYDEISVGNLYEKCLKLDGMADYFPDEYPKGKQCSREYFFTVLHTLYPDETREMILKAKKLRIPGDSDETVAETIVIDEEWKQQL